MKIFSAMFLIFGFIHFADAKIFNVRDFGATGGGTNFDTAAIQKALDSCKDSGGTVEFSPGIYLSQPLTIYSKTIFQIDSGAVLQAGTNQSDFMKTPGDWLKAKGSGEFNPFIGGEKLSDVTFTGGGIIDGGGEVWWPEAEKARQIKSGYTLPRPNLISLDRCKNVRVENLTLQNSPKFHLVPSDCEDVVISNVTILAPERAANTDAIDPSGKNFLITKCKIDVGDDNVAIKAGKKIPGRDFESENFIISDCTFLHGHGMSIGSETYGGVRNVIVKNCTFENTENGLRIKSDVRRGGLVENIFYSEITMSNVNPAITFTTFYANNSANDAARGMVSQTNNLAGEKIPVYRDIQIRNLTATCPKSAGIILGLVDNCISNVVFENVKISAKTGLTIRNAKEIHFKNCAVTVTSGSAFNTENAGIDGFSGAK